MTTPSGGAAVVQPAFATQITTLKYPLSNGQSGSISRGYMVWDDSQLPTGYSTAAKVNFLFNPSTVTASYSLIPDTSVQAAMLFPTAYNSTDLRVPLSQTVEWSLLFDRTFELWGAYDSNGAPNSLTANAAAGVDGTIDPSVVGVLVDINAMGQFTGLDTGYYSGTPGATSGTDAITASGLYGQQGVMQPIFSYVWFGLNLWYYGYVSQWDVTITHWTQYMIPMRCVINVSFTMMPLPNNNTPSNSSSNTDYSLSNIASQNLTNTSVNPGLGVSVNP
jgi:hypothetical protein